MGAPSPNAGAPSPNGHCQDPSVGNAADEPWALTDAQRALVEQNLRLAYHTLHRFARGRPDVRDDWDDYAGVAYLALCRAARTYQPERSKFSTWAVVCVENALRDEREARAVRHMRELSVASVVAGSHEGLVDEAVEARAWLSQATADLGPFDQEVLSAYATALGSRSPVAEAARALGVSAEAVREALHRIRAHLRAYAQAHGRWT